MSAERLGSLALALAAFGSVEEAASREAAALMAAIAIGLAHSGV